MSIDKSPVWVGSDANGQNGTVIDGLKLMRRFEAFEASRQSEYIKVVYSVWKESETGAKYDTKILSYFVKDIPEVPEERDADNNIITEHVDAHPAFTNWYNQLGSAVIVPAINGTLKAIPADAPDNYLTHP
jgi:hypothetical protein